MNVVRGTHDVADECERWKYHPSQIDFLWKVKRQAPKKPASNCPREIHRLADKMHSKSVTPAVPFTWLNRTPIPVQVLAFAMDASIDNFNDHRLLVQDSLLGLSIYPWNLTPCIRQPNYFGHRKMLPHRPYFSSSIWFCSTPLCYTKVFQGRNRYIVTISSREAKHII